MHAPSSFIAFTTLAMLAVAHAEITPHEAARNAQIDVLRQMRFNGKDLFIPDSAGFTPYEIAAFNADPDTKDSVQQHVETMLWLKEYKPENHRYGTSSVLLIQAGLNALGYYTGAVDGVLGKSTINAIKAYQKSNALAQTGTPGPQWLGEFYQDALKDTQYKLTTLGFNTHGIDGLMGQKTKKAILAFRSQYKIAPLSYPYIDASLISAITKRFAIKDKEIKAKKTQEQNKAEHDTAIYVQAALKALGYRVGNIDGVIGAKTINAIKKYQSAHQLTSDGEASAQTLSQLKIDITVYIQKKLNSAGYSVGKADGKLGPKSIKALRAFRVKQGLPERGGIDRQVLEKFLNVNDQPSSPSARDSNNRSVQYIQAGLRLLKENISVDGNMGANTKRAIAKFQSQHGLQPRGILDTETIGMMDVAFITTAQKKLNSMGYNAGAADGQIGPQSEQAFAAFRRDNNLLGSGIDAALMIELHDATGTRKSQSTAVTQANTGNNHISSSAKQARGRMTFKRKSGRVVGCSIKGKDIPIAWCEPFYPLPKNNYCEVTFKPRTSTVVNLWCK